MEHTGSEGEIDNLPASPLPRRSRVQSVDFRARQLTVAGLNAEFTSIGRVGEQLGQNRSHEPGSCRLRHSPAAVSVAVCSQIRRLSGFHSPTACFCIISALGDDGSPCAPSVTAEASQAGCQRFAGEFDRLLVIELRHLANEDYFRGYGAQRTSRDDTVVAVVPRRLLIDHQM